MNCFSWGKMAERISKLHLTNLFSQRKGLFVEKGTQFRRAGGSRGQKGTCPPPPILVEVKTKPVSSKDILLLPTTPDFQDFHWP